MTPVGLARFRPGGFAARVGGVLLVATCCARSPLAAQLISPGPLTAAHAGLEGMRNCTDCHELGRRGVQEDLCLACHEPLAVRIPAQRGFHARVEGSCGDCHKEHSGREADIVRFDTRAFEHEPGTGLQLVGAHADADCRECHQPQRITAPEVRLFKREGGALDRTWLGVATECLSCHRAENPHEGQFEGVACAECHNASAWHPADGFDHDRARFRLTGAHRSTACADCHPSSGDDPAARRYRPLAFGQCRSCHEDPHRGVMGAACSNCHGTGGWGQLRGNGFEDGFDHSATGYALEGAHASAACGRCHDPGQPDSAALRMTYRAGTLTRTYPRPIVESCASCHVDHHEGAFPESDGRGACSSCHAQTAWLPSSYDLFRHNDDTRFELAGAHLAVPCATCHLTYGPDAWRFDFADLTCRGCHAADDPHADQFDDLACTECHAVETFAIDAFDHERTSYPLTGAHRAVACAGCHRPESDARGQRFTRYRPLETACEACHGGGP